ncbi:MAG: hypothetical protein KKE59_06645 [Proteobacteria bacterium]|nr:hypothetical protein [Pseudomonadota bacterium]
MKIALLIDREEEGPGLKDGYFHMQFTSLSADPAKTADAATIAEVASNVEAPDDRRAIAEKFF